MNRGDTRLFLTIISTAFVTAVVTLLVSRTGDAHDPPPPEHHCSDNAAELARMQTRIDELSARVDALRDRMLHPVPAEAPPTAAQESCDEVSCVLNNYEGACCAKFLPHHGSDSLDRAMISEGISSVKARVLACGDRSDAKGQVKIHAKVDPDGTPHVEIKQTPDDALGRCVVEAVAKARFAKTQYGGSFSYPFVF